MRNLDYTENESDISNVLNQGKDVKINGEKDEDSGNFSERVYNNFKSTSYPETEDEVNELEPGLKILKETDKTYYVQDVDGRRFWLCKECYKQGKKKIFTSPLQIAAHYKKEHKVLEDEFGDDISEEEPTDDDYVPSTEELLTSEKAKKLKKLLQKAPGIKGQEKKKIDWVCYVFQENKRLNTNPEALHRYLKNQFPKMSDEDIAFIVKTVFQTVENESTYTYDDYDDITEESNTSSESTRYEDTSNYGSYYHQPGFGYGMYSQPFLIRSVDDLIKLFDFFEKRSKKGYREDEIEKRIEEKVELKLMKKQLEEMKETIKHQQKIIENLTSGEFISKIIKEQGGWNEYKLAGEILEKIDKAATGIGRELAKTNRLILMLTLGKRRGMTSDEIFDLIKQEFPDYVEE